MIGYQAEIPAGSVDADAVGGGKGDTAQDSTLPRCYCRDRRLT